MAQKANCAGCGKAAPAKPHPVMKHLVIVDCRKCGVTHAVKEAPKKEAPKKEAAKKKAAKKGKKK